MQAWDAFMRDLESKIGKKAVEKWLKPLKIVRFDACNLYLRAENTFQIHWFEEHIRKIAAKSFLNNNSHPIKIHFEFPSKKPKAKIAAESSVHIPLEMSSEPLNPAQTFSNFLFEENNRVTLELCKRLAPGSFNPLFLYGPPGSGKTHLLMACANRLQKTGLKVFFVHTETFTEHVVKAIRGSEMQTFRTIYRNQDVLVLDDVHYLANRLSTQEELFHTFNALHTSGKQIILSGPDVPTQLEGVEPRLISRFEWGIILKLIPLPPKKFGKVLKNKAHLHRFTLSDEIITFIMENFSSSSHAMMRALEALMLRHRSNSTLTLDEAFIHLNDLLQEERKKKLTEQKIIAATSTYYGMRIQDILGKSQARECVLPRKIAMFLCRKKLRMPYERIGKIFGRDHSTAIASIRQIEKNKGTEEIDAALKEIEQFLNNPKLGIRS